MLIRLMYERRRRRWTQAELSRRSGVHTTTIGWIESGRYRPEQETLTRLARALDVRDEDAALLAEAVELEPLHGPRA